MSEDKGPFSAARERFSPDAEPWANMSADAIRDAMTERIILGDREGFWDAERHWAAKAPPIERFIHDLYWETGVHLFDMDKRGLLPHPGWAMQNLVGLGLFLEKLVRDRFRDEGFPDMDAEESLLRAEWTGQEIAQTISEYPKLITPYAP